MKRGFFLSAVGRYLVLIWVLTKFMRPPASMICRIWGGKEARGTRCCGVVDDDGAVHVDFYVVAGASVACGAGGLEDGRPMLMALRKKIRAKVSAMTAETPAVLMARGRARERSRSRS